MSQSAWRPCRKHKQQNMLHITWCSFARSNGWLQWLYQPICLYMIYLFICLFLDKSARYKNIPSLGLLIADWQSTVEEASDCKGPASFLVSGINKSSEHSCESKSETVRERCIKMTRSSDSAAILCWLLLLTPNRFNPLNTRPASRDDIIHNQSHTCCLIFTRTLSMMGNYGVCARESSSLLQCLWFRRVLCTLNVFFPTLMTVSSSRTLQQQPLWRPTQARWNQSRSPSTTNPPHYKSR